jgi:hypothetical protein
MRHIHLFFATCLILSAISIAQEHRPDYSAKDIGGRVIEQREAQAEKPTGPPLSLAAAPLVALERDLMRAVKQHNLKLIDDTLSPDFLEITRDGSCYTKSESLQRLKEVEVADLALTDFHSVDVRDDVVVLTYTETVRGTYNGQPLPFRNTMSSVWRRQKKNWQMVFHGSMAMPQPPVSSAELQGLEQDLVAREGDRDVESLRQIIADDAVIVGADGTRSTFAQYSTALGRQPRLAYKISDMSATPQGADSGLVTYRLSVPGVATIPATQSSSLWRRGANGWRLVFHQETPAK